MRLSDFEMLEKADLPGGYQCVLSFNDYTQLSIISGNGAQGLDDRPYEIAVFINGDFANLPGITFNEDVRGYMTEEEVDSVISKLYSITGCMPSQV